MARPRKSIHIDKGITIFLRPNSKYWQLQVCRYNRRTCESLETGDVDAAKAVARRRADAFLSKYGPIPRDVTYQQLFDRYKRHAELRNELSTRELNYRNLQHIVRHIQTLIEPGRELLASDFTVETIESYAEARKKQGRKPETINRELGTLSVLFNKAKNSRLVLSNPVEDVERMPVATNEAPKTLEDSEVECLLTAANEPVDYHGRGKMGKGNSRGRYTPLYHFLLFLFNTAARLSEALWLEFSDINFEEGFLLLSNKDKHRIKTGKQRAIQANDVLLKMLRERWMRRGECPWVFPGMTGEQLDRKNIYRELKAAARRAGITPKRVNFLIVRHTALTASAKKGAFPFVLKEFANHATIRTTERYYIGRAGGGDWVPPSVGG